MIFLVLSFSCTSSTTSQGEILYENFCADCHMPDGSGLGSLYPALNEAERFEKIADRVPCIIEYGMTDTLHISGKVFDKPMEPVQGLKPAEIANIMNYIHRQWGKGEKFYSSNWVIERLKSRCDEE